MLWPKEKSFYLWSMSLDAFKKCHPLLSLVLHTFICVHSRRPIALFNQKNDCPFISSSMQHPYKLYYFCLLFSPTLLIYITAVSNCSGFADRQGGGDGSVQAAGQCTAPCAQVVGMCTCHLHKWSGVRSPAVHASRVAHTCALTHRFHIPVLNWLWPDSGLQSGGPVISHFLV